MKFHLIVEFSFEGINVDITCVSNGYLSFLLGTIYFNLISSFNSCDQVYF